MPEEHPNLERLHKTYQKVVSEHIKAEDKLIKKSALFIDNKKAIQASLKRYLDDYLQALKTIEQNYQKEKETLKKNHQTDLAKRKQEKKELINTHINQLKETDDTLDQSRSLATLKEEKIDTEYQMALSTLEQTITDTQNAFEQKRSEAAKIFYERVDTLEQETTHKHKKRAEAFEKEIAAVTKAREKEATLSQTEVASIEQKLTAYEQSFAKEIEAGIESYRAEITPVNEEIRLLKEEYTRDIKEIDAYYEGEIGKLKKYQKEKEKISDHQAVSAFNKDIKKQTKLQKDTKQQKTLRFEEKLTPLEEHQAALETKHQENIATMKKQGIEKISLYLNGVLVERTKDKIANNHANIETLRLKTQAEHKQTMIEIDDQIQRLNYNEALEEAELLYTYENESLEVEEAVTKEEEKRTYERTLNEVNKDRSYARALHQKERETEKLNHEKELTRLNHQNETAIKRHAFGLEAAKIEMAIEKVRKDFDKEQILIEHYHYQAKNYTALKNDTYKIYTPYFKTEIHNRKTHHIKTLKDLLKQSESDHEHITSEIESTYQQEIVIYQEAYQAIEKEHKETVQRLIDTQAVELKVEQAKIDALDVKTSKNEIKKLKQALTLKQSTHEETLTMQTRELEQKRLIYQKMIETIKTYRLHSLEEADTLLMHIRDQTAHAIHTLEELSKKELENFEKMQNEIIHSANLFATFQRQRHEQTETASENYLDRRIEKEQHSKASHYQQLIIVLDKDNARLNDAIAGYDERIKESEDAFKKACDSIEKMKEDTLKTIEETFALEKRKLDQRRMKLDRNYEASLKTLTQGKHKEKTGCFSKKAATEEELKHLLERHQKNDESDRQKYESEKAEVLAGYRSQVSKLALRLDQDAKEYLFSEDVPKVKVQILGEETVE